MHLSDCRQRLILVGGWAFSMRIFADGFLMGYSGTSSFNVHLNFYFVGSFYTGQERHHLHMWCVDLTSTILERRIIHRSTIYLDASFCRISELT